MGGIHGKKHEVARLKILRIMPRHELEQMSCHIYAETKSRRDLERELVEHWDADSVEEWVEKLLSVAKGD